VVVVESEVTWRGKKDAVVINVPTAEGFIIPAGTNGGAGRWQRGTRPAAAGGSPFTARLEPKRKRPRKSDRREKARSSVA